VTTGTGKFVAIEGIDGSGKGRQQSLLIQKLKEVGLQVKSVEFPQYESSLFGKEVGLMLSGKYGPIENIHPSIASIVYAADRWKASSSIGHALTKSVNVIANRYTLSNMAHQSARLPAEQRWEFVNFLDRLEYSNDGFAIPKPDLYIYLKVSPEKAQELILKKAERDYLKGADKDLLEADIEHQIEAAKMYELLAERLPGIITVDCMDHEGELLLPEKIHELVWSEARLTLYGENPEGRIKGERE